MAVLKKNPRIGIMGGSFNPPHFGHINSLLTVQKKFQLDLVYVVPAFQSPLASHIKEASPFQRLEMLKRAFKDCSFVRLDDQEILRGGKSYSYVTVETIAAKYPLAELFFILGMDQFEKLDEWKNVPKILKKSHLIVTSRPGSSAFPKKKQDLPECLRERALASSFKETLTLKGLKDICFCALKKDQDISSSLIRERAGKGLSLNHLVPSSLQTYIHRVYSGKGGLKDIEELAEFCRKELEAKKAFHIKMYRFTSLSLPFSMGLIASSLNPPHSRALSSYLEEKIKKSFSLRLLGKEGEGQWVALDYGILGIHIFYDYNRAKYGLDEIWNTFSQIS